MAISPVQGNNPTIAVGSVTGLGTGVATALAVNVGSAGAPVLVNGVLGTPSSGVLTNATGLPAAGLLAVVQSRLLTRFEPLAGSSRQWTVSGTRTAIAQTAYFVFLGRVAAAFTATKVWLHLSTAALGTVEVEVGLFSTPAGPNGANQSVTKIVSTDTVDDLVGAGTGLRRANATSFAQAIAVDTFLWAGFRSNYSVTQPTFVGALGEQGNGAVLTTTSATTLTGAGPWTGAVAGSNSSPNAPAMFVTDV